MADVLVDNGTETDYKASTKTLAGGAPAPQVPAVELVTAVEGGARTDLARAEDSAHASGAMGLMMLGVRKDAAAPLADADGDYIPAIFDANGRLHVNIGAALAAVRTTDSVAAALATDAVMNNLTALTPKYAKANIAASTTDGAVVAAVASKKIRVLSFRVMAGGTGTNVTFNSKPGGAGTAISELMACPANGGQHGAFCPVGHFETVAGEGLAVTTGPGSTVGVGVVYVEV